MSLSVSLCIWFSYQWVRFEVCRPGDGQVAHGLSEDDASVNFESFQRLQSCEEILTNQNLTAEQSGAGEPIATKHYKTIELEFGRLDFCNI